MLIEKFLQKYNMSDRAMHKRAKIEICHMKAGKNKEE